MKGRSLLPAVAALALVLGCENPQEPDGLRAPSDPSKIISDGAHGGNKDFFFLPPMVPLPLGNPDFELGKFNNALRPSLRIEICELNSDNLRTDGLPTGATTCGLMKKTFAPGTVKLVNLPLVENGWWNFFKLPPDGFYYVLWDTRQSDLNVNKYYRIKVYVDGIADALGVADVDPMSSLRQWKYSLTGEVIQLIDDVMLPIAFRVERGALCAGGTCNSATITNYSPAGSQTVTVDPGGGSIAGARFPNGWLPSATSPGCTPETCPQSVVVTIAQVNIGGGGGSAPPTICHPALDPRLQQFKGCFNFTTTPRLRAINPAGDQFAQPVTVAVCFELDGTGDPREKFVELYSSGPEEPPHALPNVSDGGLLGVLAKDCTPPPPTALRSSNPLTQFAGSGWRMLKGGLGRVFGIKTAYAVDFGLGGIVKGFSNISPVLTAEIQAYTSTELTLGPGVTTTSTARIVGNSQHGSSLLTTGIGGLPVTFTPSGGSMVRSLAAGAPPAATTPITVITNINPVDGSAVSGGGFAPVNWTMPTPTTPGIHTYTLSADGPALRGPVVFSATFTVNEVWQVIESGGFNGTWTRRGSTGVFDAVWVPAGGGGGQIIGVMNYTRTGTQVHFQRTYSSEGALCVYDGTLAADGLSASGTETCPGNPTVYTWTATITAPYPAPPPPAVPIMLSMQTGATIQLSATAPDVVAAWSSSAPTKVQVSATGLATAIVGGENSNGGDGATVTSVLNTGSAGPTWLVNSPFTIFPRVTTAVWAPVGGAASYDVGTEYGNGCTGYANCDTWTTGVGATGIAGSSSSFVFTFIGTQPGRWRVTARDATGAVMPGSPSSWIYFRYIDGL